MNTRAPIHGILLFNFLKFHILLKNYPYSVPGFSYNTPYYHVLQHPVLIPVSARSFVRQALIISIYVYLLPPYQSFPLPCTSSLPSVQQCNVLYASSFSRYSFSICWYAFLYQICLQALIVSTSAATSPCQLDHISCYAICISHSSSFSSVNALQWM